MQTACLPWDSKFTGLFFKTQGDTRLGSFSPQLSTGLAVARVALVGALSLLHWSISVSPSVAAEKSKRTGYLPACGKRTQKNTALLILNLSECPHGICHESLIAFYKVRTFVLLHV